MVVKSKNTYALCPYYRTPLLLPVDSISVCHGKGVWMIDPCLLEVGSLDVLDLGLVAELEDFVVAVRTVLGLVGSVRQPFLLHLELRLRHCCHLANYNSREFVMITLQSSILI